MNIYDYVAYSNPAGANSVIQYYGLRPSHDPRITSKMLAFCVTKRGQEALDMIAKAHPDYQLIQSSIDPKLPENDKFSNSNGGCGCNSCNSFNNADGQNSGSKFRITDKSELFITGGLMLIGLALVLKLMK